MAPTSSSPLALVNRDPPGADLLVALALVNRDPPGADILVALALVSRGPRSPRARQRPPQLR